MTTQALSGWTCQFHRCIQQIRIHCMPTDCKVALRDGAQYWHHYLLTEARERAGLNSTRIDTKVILDTKFKNIPKNPLQLVWSYANTQCARFMLIRIVQFSKEKFHTSQPLNSCRALHMCSCRQWCSWRVLTLTLLLPFILTLTTQTTWLQHGKQKKFNKRQQNWFSAPTGSKLRRESELTCSESFA